MFFHIPDCLCSCFDDDSHCISLRMILWRCFPALGWHFILPPPTCRHPADTFSHPSHLCLPPIFPLSIFLFLCSFLSSLNGSSLLWCKSCVLMTWLLTAPPPPFPSPHAAHTACWAKAAGVPIQNRQTHMWVTHEGDTHLHTFCLYSPTTADINLCHLCTGT